MLPDIDSWPDRLDALLKESSGPLHRVVVLRETDSTQDASRRLKLTAGEVVVAGRQTAGRGRLGRAWTDSAGEGVAMTAVTRWESPERLSIAAAVATALAAESLLGHPVSIKWPNDIMVGHRKLAGILIEQTADYAYIGIGVNVLQGTWDKPLQGMAISLTESGATVTRLDVIAALLEHLNTGLSAPNAVLTAAFAERDVLRGRPARFRTNGELVCGVVREIDPMRGLIVATDSGEVWLSAATTTVVQS